MTPGSRGVLRFWRSTGLADRYIYPTGAQTILMTSPPNPKRKLRVGIMVNQLEVAAWVKRAIELIQNSEHARVALVIINDSPTYRATNRGTFGRKLRKNIRRLLPLLLSKILDVVEIKLIHSHQSVSDAQARCDIQDLVSDCHHLKAKPRKTRFSDYLDDESVTAINAAELDVIFRFGFRILRGDILRAARCGVWSWHHGDNRTNRGGPAGYWEVMESWPTTGSILQILTGDMDNGLVLERSSSRTYSTSLRDSQSRTLWKSIMFAPRQLKRLHELGADEFLARARANNTEPMLYSNRLYTSPSSSQRAALVGKKLVEKIKFNSLNRFYHEQWCLIYKFGPTPATTLWRFKTIIPSNRKSWADPHVVYRDKRYYIFFEAFSQTEQGRLMVLTLTKNGDVSDPQPLQLDNAHHLSYPHIFEHEGETYLVPESQSANKVTLYKCVEFPLEWRFVCHLMEDVPATDSTLLFAQGRWWLFTSIIEQQGGSPHDELFLFHSDNLQGADWTPHPLNPIVSDVTRARCAGQIFEHNGAWYRPSQSGAPRYGYGINLNKITALSETDYQEQLITTATPDWDKHIKGLHTFNFGGELTVSDIQLRQPVRPWLTRLGF